MTQSGKNLETIEDVVEVEVNTIKQRDDIKCQINLLSISDKIINFLDHLTGLQRRMGNYWLLY